MAGEWLKFDCSLPEKPEVLAITVSMGWDDPDLTVGKLMRVFRWFDQHTIDGNAKNVTAALLNRVVGVSGIAEAMAEVNWLIVSACGLSLANFDRHNGATAKSRAQTAKRVANHRHGADSNGASVTGALAREEKRREEEKEPKGSSRQTDLPACPHDQIIEQYHEKLPNLPRVKLNTEARRKAMRTFWRWVLTSKKSDDQPRANGADQALAWIAAYFERASHNAWLMGDGSGAGKHASWKADFDFLLTEKGRKHVIEKTEAAA